MSNKKLPSSTITVNKKARFEYFIEEEFEAGLVLLGWEVKSLRAGKINISDSHIIIKNGEVFLWGAQIQPLSTAATHLTPEPGRTRKLLLKRREISRLIGAVERQGYTLTPLSLYWARNCVKIKFALAKGKKMHDKRDTIKQRDWNRDKARILKSY